MEKRDVERLLQLALDRSSGDQTEVCASASRWALTRFANSVIHQNMSSELTRVRVRVALGRKTASGATTRLDENGVADLVDEVVRMARAQDANPDFVSFPEPDVAREPAEQYFSSTADSTPEERADMVKSIISEADRIGGTVAGSVFTRAYEHSIVNSLGVNSGYRGTAADVVSVVTAPDGGFGYAAATSSDISDIDASSIGCEAAGRARDSRNPSDLAPGDYECVLMPYAVADMVESFAAMGFRALAYQEGRSFLCGKLGQSIADESISIWDDGLDPSTLVASCDGEGVPKQRVDLVDRGVAGGLLYTSYSAHKEGRKSTGHSPIGEGESSGSWLNLLMAPGNASVDDMIASTRRGVLVTRFHYTNTAHLMTAAITGMTRDGTFLIENGKIAGPVKNLRFTQSILSALNDTEMVGRERRLVGGAFVPALKVRRFHFTSATEF